MDIKLLQELALESDFKSRLSLHKQAWIPRTSHLHLQSFFVGLLITASSLGRLVNRVFLVFQTIGGSIVVSAAQTGFANRLLSSLKTNAPGVDPAKVLATGATEIRNVFAKEDVHGILLSYLDGLHVAFALAIALGGMSFLAALFVPWKRVNVSRAFGVTSENATED